MNKQWLWLYCLMQEMHFKRRQGLAKEGAFGKSIWQKEEGIWHGNNQMPNSGKSGQKESNSALFYNQ